jgi:hypothetical protein
MIPYIAYTEDSGPIPIFVTLSAILVIVTGFFAIRAGWKQLLNLSCWMFAHLFALVCVGALSFSINRLLTRQVQIAVRDKAYSVEQQAFDLRIIATYDGWFGFILLGGAMLGIIAAFCSIKRS